MHRTQGCELLEEGIGPSLDKATPCNSDLEFKGSQLEAGRKFTGGWKELVTLCLRVQDARLFVSVCSLDTCFGISNTQYL